MYRRIESVVGFAALLLVQTGCADAASADGDPEPLPEATLNDVASVCDGSGTLKLAVRLDSFHNIAPIQFFFRENGAWWLYIDGDCDAWTYFRCNPDPSSGAAFPYPEQWCPARHKALSSTEAVELLNALGWVHWARYDGKEFRASLRGGVATFVSGSTEFTYGTLYEGPEGAALRNLFDDVNQAVGEFYLEAQPVTGDVRVSVQEGETSIEGFYDTPPWMHAVWPEDVVDFDIAEEAKSTWPYCMGVSRLMTGDAAERFRELREEFWNPESGFRNGTAIVVEVDGKPYEVRIRDTIPLEQENGLVRVSRYGDSECVGGLGISPPDSFE